MTHGEDGFTLAEALMALLVISLALAGLMQAGLMLGRLDRKQTVSADRLASMHAFETKLQSELLPLQPLDGDKVRGNAQSLDYACAQGRCALTPPDGRLAYLAMGRERADWPPPAVPGQGAPRLEAVVWRDESGKNLAVVKFPVEHGRDCLFDMISRSCLQPESAASAS